MGLVVRAFAATDSVTELTALIHRAYAPLAAKGLRYVASHQSDDITRERMENGVTFVAVLERVVVGTVTIHPHDLEPDCAWYGRPDVAVMEMLAVDPPYQRRGIATRLIAVAEERAREWSARELALDTSEHASELIALYETLGYRRVDQLARPVVNYASIVLSKTL